MRTGNDVTELVGHTPLVRLQRVVEGGDGEVWAKLEVMNPGGSVKDRAAMGIVLDAERRGVLKPGDTICEATAGNTGVGLALIGIQRGYRVKLFVPEGFAEEKCILMRAFGADVEELLQRVLEIALGGVDAAADAVEDLVGSFENAAEGELVGAGIEEAALPDARVNAHVAAAVPFGFDEHVDEGSVFLGSKVAGQPGSWSRCRTADNDGFPLSP